MSMQLENNTFKGPNGENLYIKLHAHSVPGCPKVQLWDDEGPYCTLSCAIPGVEFAHGEFIAKTWSENEEVAAAALASGLFEDTGKRVQSGFVEAQIWKIKGLVAINPRYVRYAEVHGASPDEMMAKDRQRFPGGVMCGFILWIDQAWADFLAPYGGNKLDLPIGKGCTQEMFDQFLQSYTKKGKGGGHES